jgi:hypothetical protein
VEGAVESDFFDWVLLDADGPDFVTRVARQAARFKLENVQTDVLKSLYESLIDPEQRHDLGEYYVLVSRDSPVLSCCRRGEDT